ncbi:hypothetical protein [Oceaniradius stylonematis]|uniref:hypothetical protein n=1 Tax=Oceaniradius stylonematis TaxID=2184161 RepID=UPI00273F2D26|nr:hypothetical protein [Oceaniradius stylonematis]
MNSFNRILRRDAEADFRLGTPSKDEAARDRRLTAMASLNPSGFRQHKNEPRKDAQGKTRGDRKREGRARANAKVSEERDEQFMHSGTLRKRREAEALRAAQKGAAG